MREGEAPRSQGLDIKGLIQQYGPMAAAAIPAIILAKGRAGQELGNIFKKLAPQHFERLNKSPFPFMLSRMDDPIGGPLHQVVLDHPAIDRVSRRGQPMLHPLFDDAERYLGRRPRAISSINVPENYDPISSGLHEFGHATGVERVLSQFPGANTIPAAIIGGHHLDILDNPKSREVIKSALQRRPEHRQYFAGRLATEPRQDYLYPALGELLNDVWTQRMVERSGNKWTSITQHPSWDYSAKQARRMPGVGELVEYAAQRGTLPESQRQNQLRALDELIKALHQPAPVSPSRPSPPVSPAPSAARPGSPPSRRPPSPTESRPPR